MKPLSTAMVSSLRGESSARAGEPASAPARSGASHGRMAKRYVTNRSGSRKGGEAGRRGRDQGEALAGARVLKLELDGVEHQARRGRPAVEPVADQRVADRRGVDADLVGAAGVQLDGQRGAGAGPADRGEAGAGLLSAR